VRKKDVDGMMENLSGHALLGAKLGDCRNGSKSAQATSTHTNELLASIGQNLKKVVAGTLRRRGRSREVWPRISSAFSVAREDCN